jgi:putative ABC transport system permease protein
MDAPIRSLDVLSLVLSYLLFLTVFTLIRLRRIPLGRTVLIATLRMTVQLILVGFVLRFIFGLSLWYVVLAHLLLMLFFASHVILRRAEIRLPGLWRLILISLVLGAGSVIFFIILLVIRQSPWYEPRYFIPLAGMIIGNSLNGCVLAVDRYYDGIQGRRKEIEVLLSLGASRDEAQRTAFIRAFRAALTPTLAAMSAMGLVFLPGMMTGQVLAGSEPLTAVKYQIVIMAAILGSVSLTSLLVLTLMERKIFTRHHQLNEEFLS